MERALLACILLVCVAGGMSQLEDNTESPNYDQMEDAFYNTTTGSPVLSTGSGDGDTTTTGSGITPTDFTEPPTCFLLRPPDLIENCTVPEAVSSRAIATMDTALNQGVCHSLCVEEQTTINDEQQLNGYPNWRMAYSSFFLSEDGRNGQNCLARDGTNTCQVPTSCPSDFSPLMDCKRGCETRLRGVGSNCRRICRQECEDECLNTLLPGLGCEVGRFPLPCRASCSASECSVGCDEAPETSLSFEDLQDFNDDAGPLHPTLPPNVTHIRNTLYRVDVETALPQVSPTLSRSASRLIGYCTVVIKVEGDDCMERFYVLDDTNEVELGDFACQIVNISYAIATAFTGVSNFSPPVTMAVISKQPPVPPSCQPEVVNVTVEQDNRVGFFQQHIVNVSWEPIGCEDLEGYRISLVTSIRFCGAIRDRNLDRTATSYTFQASTPFSGDGDRDDEVRTPPVTECTYELTLEALPRNIGDEPFVTNVPTGEYTLPNDDDLDLTCGAQYKERSDSYLVNLGLTLNSAFTPTIIEAISYLQIFRAETDSNANPVPGREILSERLYINATTLNYEYFDLLLPLAEKVEFQEYTITVVWRSSVPRRLLLTSDVNFETFCLTQRLEFGTPLPVQSENITIGNVTVSATRPGKHNVTVNFDFSYDRGTRGVPTVFWLWLDDAPATNETVTQERISGTQRSGAITQSFSTLNDSFDYFFQIQVSTSLFRSPWNDPPIKGNISRDVIVPRTLGDNDYDVTRFTYRTSTNMGGELEVFVDIDVTHRVQFEGTLSEVEVCISEQELEASESTCPGENSDTFAATPNVKRITRTITLEGLGVRLFIQARGVSAANIEGKWSNPELINIEDIPPPVNIASELTSAEIVIDNDGIKSYRVTMTVNWENTIPTPETTRKRQAPVREAEMTITGYTIVIGDEQIEEPYGEIPGSSIQRAVTDLATNSTTITNTITIDNNATDPVLYVQMRSSGDGTFGSWSEAVAVNLTALTQGSSSSAALAAGVSVLAVVAVITAVVIFVVVIFLCWKQCKLRHGLKGDGKQGTFNLWSDNYPTVPYIPPGMVKGKEIMQDEWEIPTTDVIVEDHLGEGAFGLVFKGTVRGPLRNPKLTAKVRQAIGLPVAIKLLKDTASNKEKSDFWTEIDMMKKISEGFCAHVVNMVGCVTSQEPLCLITEFVPHGDLLDYLRNQRKKNASRKREEKYLRIQLEQQKKAYEDMKRQMIILQSAQSDAPGEGRIVAGGSGYADFEDANKTADGPPTDAPPTDGVLDSQESFSSGNSPTAEKPLLETSASSPYADLTAGGNVAVPPAETGQTQQQVVEQPNGVAPYLEPKNEYSHLDPASAKEAEVAEEDEIYAELGDLDGNDLMQFAYQIATGMEYLASINIVHRDLACRNILVGEGKNLKITDFGLSREVEDVYVKTTKGRLPLKWMALESIEAREFTTNSDVWSYGIVLWEIGTMGGFPYPTIQNQDLLMMLKQGYRLEKPDNCAPEVYEIMLECWQEHPVDRPGFSELRKKFSNLLLATTGDTYMELEVDDSKVYYTMAEEEEEALKARKESVSSDDSDSSIKKKKGKKIEKPKWALNNPYVPTPSTFKDDHVHIDDEHYHAPTNFQEAEEEKVSDEIQPSTMIDVVDIEQHGPSAETPSSHHAPLTGSLSLSAGTPQQTAVLLEDQVGIPLSFISSDKPPRHQSVQSKVSNPYVDDPRTKQLLEGEQAETSKMGALELSLRMRAGGENAVSAL